MVRGLEPYLKTIMKVNEPLAVEAVKLMMTLLDY